VKKDRVYLSPPHLGGQEIDFIRMALESNYIAPLGPMVDAFEHDICDYTEINNCVAVSSGTAALHLALHVLGVNPGDEVLASTLTFIGSVTPIVFRGATPVFIDSDRTSWCMDADLLADWLSICKKRGKLPKAVVVTDLYGQCADFDRISQVCLPLNIPVVSDAAEALGATYKGRQAGKGAKGAVFSFNGNKIITTSGGGMFASDDQALTERARFLSQQARDSAPHYEHSEIGYNYRMSNILAAIGRGQLRVLEERVARKREIFDLYNEALDDLPGLEFMPEAPYGQCSRWLSVVLITPEEFGTDRETVRVALENENIESRPLWKPMHMQPVFKGHKTVGGAVSEDLFERGLCLPSGTQMSDADLERVVEVVRKCCRAAV
jgi:dTDP-4-amino-4,6-dideoxygalactose transaminase